MTKAELIEALSPFPDDTMIVIPGYEGGRKEVEWTEEIKLKLNVNTEWYYGPHEEDTRGDTNAIYIH
jgi:hypothetical protein